VLVLSTTIGILGAACVVAGVFLLAGLGWALIAAGVLLLAACVGLTRDEHFRSPAPAGERQ
jgi:hypothetical protein